MGPCKVAVAQQESHPRGFKDEAHTAALEQSNPMSERNIARHCGGTLVPTGASRGYHPYNSSRLLLAAQNKAAKAALRDIPRGEKLPRGHKDSPSRGPSPQ